MSSARIDRLLKRGLIVASLVALAQAVVFAVGWFMVYEDTHQEVAKSVEEVIVQSNVAAADAVVRLLGGLPSVDEVGSEDWLRTQEVIENLELGGSGFACVLDSQGNVACHPDIREMPGLREVNLGEMTVLDFDGTPGGALADGASEDVSTGLVDVGFDGVHYFATVRDAASGAQLVVHQPVSGLTAASSTVTGTMLSSMLGVGSLLIFLTAALAAILVRAHDRTMARWNRQLESLVDERTAELVESHRTILFGIAKLAEHRDNDTGLHVERMCAFTGILAREYGRRFGGLEETWIEDVQLAASMHDIGKVAIPDSILLKPDKLTTEEFERMKRHATVGEEALRAVRERVHDTRLLDLGIEIAGGHHERWDGGGYPRGLAGGSIPLSARLVAVADVFDALMSKRSYKPAFPFEKVVGIIREGSGNHFDPRAVECFDAVADELRRIHATHSDVDSLPSPLPHVESRELLVRSGAA